MATVQPWECLLYPGGGSGLDDGEAGKVLEQGMRMANLKATRMMMATRRATAEILWPMV